jgi:hypothetical protein
VLRELGVIGTGGVSIIGADTVGLDRLLTAYGALPAALRATTERVDETGIPGAGFSFGYSATPGAPSSFFFNNGHIAPVEMVNVLFSSGGDLHVGATRFLKINNSGLSANAAFTVGTNHDLFLRAADLIDLKGHPSSGMMFSNDIRSITMAAATINLTNVSFPVGSVASLNAKLGGVNFGSSIPNHVNFVSNVTYGTQPLTSAADLFGATSLNKANGNIAIGSLNAPAALPTHFAPGTTRTAP